MITYYVSKVSKPAAVQPDDEFHLYLHGKRVHSQDITCVDVISHWSYVDIPGIGISYFIGNDKLVDFMAERFPDAERIRRLPEPELIEEIPNEPLDKCGL